QGWITYSSEGWPRLKAVA
ncbi:hypothetical protein A2U01_0081524, partial [Trifolium medium]|nr:hypothetical protein [Trifolium medium]